MGPYRHRVRIDQKARSQNPTTGAITETWSTFRESVPARIRALSGRELLAAQAMNAEVTTAIEIRWLRGVTATMRVVNTHDDDRTYAIRAVLPDETQRRELRLMCESGVSEGQ